VIELRSSFPSERSARAFGEHVSDRLNCKHAVSILEVNREPTCWYRLAVPARHIKRAEELRITWEAAIAAVGSSESEIK